MVTFKGQFFPSQMRHCLLMDWALNYLHFSFCWLWIQTNPKLHLYILIENVLRDLSNNCFCRIVVATLRTKQKMSLPVHCFQNIRRWSRVDEWETFLLEIFIIVHHHQRYRKNTFGNQYLKAQKKYPLSRFFKLFCHFQFRLLLLCLAISTNTGYYEFVLMILKELANSLSQLQKPRLTPGPRGFTTFVKYHKV